MRLGTRLYLGVSGVAITGILGVPLTFCPKPWSRVAGWSMPPESDLEDYFARSLGAIGFSLGAACFAAALGRHPPRSLIFLLSTLGATAAGVHLIGVLRGRYPPREAVEIPFLLAWSAWGAAVLVRELGARR